MFSGPTAFKPPFAPLDFGADEGETISTPIESEAVPDDPDLGDVDLPVAGEVAAHEAWAGFLDRIGDYSDERDRPDLDTTSRMSPYLRFGAIHPRTMLADLGPADGAYRNELAWREFYAAVLHAWPDSARDYFRPQLRGLPYVTGRDLADRLTAWQEGRTGYPLVDAGMRQLLAEGWMHNRVRMLVASFLVKDLQVEWQHGARHFLRHLIDGDLASNQHNWQWVAGYGTDAAPYFRIFNPVTQSEKFDPEGRFIRKYVPELADLPNKALHAPWRADAQTLSDAGVVLGRNYPEPLVAHDVARQETLTRYAVVKSPATSAEASGAPGAG